MNLLTHFSRFFYRSIGIATFAATLFLTGCNNDTGSNELPGSGHDHGHEESISVKKIGTPLRVTQVAGHHDVTQLVGFATGNKVMYLLTPARNLYEPLDWSDGANATRSQHSFDGHGEHFLVLDTTGRLHILETGATSADWHYKAGLDVVSSTSLTAGAKLTVSQVEDKAFITDPENDRIQVVDLEAGALATAIDLPFTPSAAGIAWTGVTAGHDHEHEGEEAHEEDEEHGHGAHPGRLVLASSTHAFVYDLEEEALLADDGLALDYAPAALHASPGYRYALITQQPATAGHQVQFLDSGLYGHGDHIHEDAPALLTFKLLGTTPAHYRSVDGQGALFFDGGSGPRFVLFNDESLAAGGVIATENVLAAHHGIAEPRGEVVLASKADRSGVLAYHLHDDHFHEEGTIEEECQGLHGGGSNAGWSGFGCEDGVLLVGLAEEHDHEH